MTAELNSKAAQARKAAANDETGLRLALSVALGELDRSAKAIRMMTEAEVDVMLADCLPGGDYCDPQAVADAIRAWCRRRPTAIAKRMAESAKMIRDSVSLTDAQRHELESKAAQARWRNAGGKR